MNQEEVINRPFEDKETYLKRLRYKFWLYFIAITCLTLILIIFIIALTLISMPTEYSFMIKMDNNTLEAFKSINYTALNYTG